MTFFRLLTNNWRNRLKLKRWRAALHLNTHLADFNALYKDVNGFALSKQARLTFDEPSLTYGEIQFESFIALLCQIPLDERSVFCDLGSGVGKAVIACQLVFDVELAIGIELLTPLHDKACSVQARWQHMAPQKAKKVLFINQDFFNDIPKHATVIFINAAAFFGQTWQNLIEQLSKLKHLTHLITTKAINHPHWVLEKKTLITMSWGLADAWVYQVIFT